jgi:DNA-directed RNA polymerase specialized sigma24 family protein
VPDAGIAAALGIEPESVEPLVRLARAKLERCIEAAGEPATEVI